MLGLKLWFESPDVAFVLNHQKKKKKEKQKQIRQDTSVACWQGQRDRKLPRGLMGNVEWILIGLGNQSVTPKTVKPFDIRNGPTIKRLEISHRLA